MPRNRMPALRTGLLLAAVAFVALASSPASTLGAAAPQIPQGLQQRAEHVGRVRVIVELGLPSGDHVPEGLLPDAASVLEQRQMVAARRAELLSRLPPAAYRVIHQYQTVPYVALDVSAAALAVLQNSPGIRQVIDDAIVRPVLAQSGPLVQADQVWAGGYDGTGNMIAVLDTGVDSTHPFLAGKVLEEACYSSTVPNISQSFCPNGLDQQIGAGAAVPCPLSDCLHGTHVAGIAAGNGDSADEPFSGVAKGADLMAVQVFSRITDPSSCGGAAPCVGGFTSDIIAGLERVYAVAWQRNIASVNMSLGGSMFTAPCDDEPYKPAIDNLRAIGIATVVASGNSGSTFGISTPACISSAISVGSTTKTDTVSWFSNVAPFLSLFAPGESITSSVPGGGFSILSGTSMATPHVAGAWALLRQAMPGASVSTVLDSLRQTGLPVTDTRFLGTATIPRVRIFQALATLVSVTNPLPVMSALSPVRTQAGSGPLTLTIAGSGFNAFSAVRWNGTARPTTVVSTTTLRASIPSTDFSVVGTAEVSVFAPEPGGGTSSAFTFTIDPGPTLAVNAPTVSPGSPATVTLMNGAGGSADWLALAATSAPNTSYLKWTYVGSGVTTRTWTVTMPATAGTYEFRLFLNNGYTRAATSPPVTVDPSFNPVPAVTSLSPTNAIGGGAAFALTVNGSGFVASSVVQWNGAARATTYVSATRLQAAIGANDIAATGTAQVSVVSPAPGGGSSGALPFTIAPPPSLTVSATNVAGGSSVTATLTNGTGGSGDWLALAATSAPNTSYLKWTYVGSGVTTRTWTVTMPVTAGAYEFRLFLNSGYTRAATSPPVTVDPSLNAIPAVTSLSPSGAIVGGAAFALTVNGSGFVASSVVQWNGAARATTYVSATRLQAAIGANDIAAAATAQVSVVSPAPGGGSSAALPFFIAPPPSLTVSATSVTGGSSVTATLTNGFGGSSDWLALAAASAPNTSYLKWTYVGSGVTTRTWTVTMPATAGIYEFRLFLNNGYTRAATSPTITVTP